MATRRAPRRACSSMPRRRRSWRWPRSRGCASRSTLDGITHLVVASCTGFVAPGIDQIIARALGLPDVERTLVGFMGCYAAVSALRTAYHIVRSEPEARVLAVTVELCSLHLQETQAARIPARHAPVQRRRRGGPGHRASRVGSR